MWQHRGLEEKSIVLLQQKDLHRARVWVSGACWGLDQKAQKISGITIDIYDYPRISEISRYISRVQVPRCYQYMSAFPSNISEDAQERLWSRVQLEVFTTQDALAEP
jgi:hypothetical protein